MTLSALRFERSTVRDTWRLAMSLAVLLALSLPRDTMCDGAIAPLPDADGLKHLAGGVRHAFEEGRCELTLLPVAAAELAAGVAEAPTTPLHLPPAVASACGEWVRAALAAGEEPGLSLSPALGFRDWPQPGRDVAVIRVQHSGGEWLSVQSASELVLVVAGLVNGASNGAASASPWLDLLDATIWPEVDAAGKPVPWGHGEVFLPSGSNRSGMVLRDSAELSLTAGIWALGPDLPFGSANVVVWDATGNMVITLEKRWHSGGARAYPRDMPGLSVLETKPPPKPTADQTPVAEWNSAPVQIEFYADPLQFDEGHYLGEPFLVCGRLPRGLERLPTGEQTDEARVAALAQCRAHMHERICPDGVTRLMHFYRAGDAGADVHFRAKYLIEDRRLLVWGVVGRETGVYVEPVAVESPGEFAEHLAAFCKIDQDVSAAKRGDDFTVAGEWGRASTVTGYRRWYDFALGRDTVEPMMGLLVRFFDRRGER